MLVSEWDRHRSIIIDRLSSRLPSIWVDIVVLVIHLSSKEVEECFVLVLFTFLWLSSSCSFFLFLSLAHLEVCKQQTESSNNEYYEEIHDFESNVSLHIHFIPVLNFFSDQLLFGLNFSDFFWNSSFFG